MTGPSRPTPPSAIDGYRRLARTRGAVAAEASTELLTDAASPRVSRRRRPRAGARLVGSLRLVGFVGVIVLIVATSVGLASAGTSRDSAPRADAATTSPDTSSNDSSGTTSSSASSSAPTAIDDGPSSSTTPAPSSSGSSSSGSEGSVAVESDAVAEVDGSAAASDEHAGHHATAVEAVAAGPARTTASRELPFSGPPVEVQRVLLGGALLVLVGMLVQAAGAPLPARAHTRRP